MATCARCGGSGSDPDPYPEEQCCGNFITDPLQSLEAVCCGNPDVIEVEGPCTACGGSGVTPE